MDEALPHFEAAVEASKASDYPRAREQLERFLAIDPEDVGAWSLYASVLEKLGCFREAIDVARRVVGDPTATRIYLKYDVIGRCLWQLGDFAGAEQAFRASLGVKTRPEGLIFLAALLEEIGRLGEAIDCLRDALELEPDNAEAHYNLGSCYWTLGDPALAEHHRRWAEECDPEYAESRRRDDEESRE